MKHPLSKDGSKNIQVEVLNIAYSDSTESNCKVHCELQLTANGKKVDLSSGYNDMLRYHDGLAWRIYINNKSDGSQGNFHFSLEKGSTKIVSNDLTLWYDRNIVLEYASMPIFRFEPYDKSVFIAAQQERIRKAEEARKEAARIAEEERRKAEDALYQRQDMLLTPEYLANWVGMSNFTKENIENDCHVVPVGYQGGKVFYDFRKCPVTMEYAGSNNVCIELSFRLYGEDGYNFKKDLINYGYKIVKTEKAFVTENDFLDAGFGKCETYKCMLKNGDYSTCTILEGQAFMFTFNRTKN